jgi:nitronate monooxygenase
VVQGLINDVPTCQALVQRIVEQARQLIDQRLKGMLVS